MQSQLPMSPQLIYDDMDDEWREVKQRMSVGSLIVGRVICHAHFGVFLELPCMPFKGLIRIVDFKDAERMTAAEFPAIGTDVKAVILGFDDHDKQIVLGVKPSQLASAKQEPL